MSTFLLPHSGVSVWRGGRVAAIGEGGSAGKNTEIFRTSPCSFGGIIMEAVVLACGVFQILHFESTQLTLITPVALFL